MLVIVSAVFKQKQRLFLNSYLISSQKRPKGASFRSFSVVFLSFSVNFAIKAERSLRRDARGVRKAARVVMSSAKQNADFPAAARRRDFSSFFRRLYQIDIVLLLTNHTRRASKAEARGEADLRALVVRGCNIEFRAQLTQEQAASESSCARAQTSSPMRVSSRSSKWKKSGANCSSIDLRSSPRSSVSPVKIMR